MRNRLGKVEDLPLFLKRGEVAEVLGISAAAASRLIARNVLPVVRIGERSARVPRAEFLRWIADNTAKTA